MVKRYLLLFKFTPILGLSDSYIYIVTFVGLITMIFGSVTALRQYDLKGILAYSTISQLGMIMSMVGLGGGIAQHSSGPMADVYINFIRRFIPFNESRHI